MCYHNCATRIGLLKFYNKSCAVRVVLQQMCRHSSPAAHLTPWPHLPPNRHPPTTIIFLVIILFILKPSFIILFIIILITILTTSSTPAPSLPPPTIIIFLLAVLEFILITKFVIILIAILNHLHVIKVCIIILNISTATQVLTTNAPLCSSVQCDMKDTVRVTQGEPCYRYK